MTSLYCVVKPTRQWSLRACILVPRLARIRCGCGSVGKSLRCFSACFLSVLGKFDMRGC
ncbi:hypothetical protein F5144DRAFT_586905 [Chaetomium tenue]|uniref:Uncharacterized protein n=1 Tax=Chaetomium tenue TaxID=1854479 RepID=A0ACB7P1C7_9PEZI|nr:hypothetical protein F5144DRAFT_586905 [Chaetomium globosum]